MPASGPQRTVSEARRGIIATVCLIGNMALRAHSPLKNCRGVNPCRNTIEFVYTWAGWFRRPLGLWACGVMMVRPMRLILVGVVLGSLATPVLAFQETTSGAGATAPPAAVTESEPPKASAEPGK